jgi:CO/xanthine dehydrogenase Mo-binding subunit
MAFVKYELYRTYVGAVATVEVYRQSGALRVKHGVVVHDCGQVIDPDGVKNQIKRNVVQIEPAARSSERRSDAETSYQKICGISPFWSSCLTIVWRTSTG